MIETNLIPFTFAKDELELSLVVHTDKRPGKEHYKPLMKEKFPETLLKGNEKRLKKIERLYTNFGEPDKVDFKTTIKLSEQPMFSLHYARHILRHYFETIPNAIVSSDFIRDISVWLPAKDQNDSRFKVYFDFKVKVQYGHMTEGPELIVTYNGISRVLSQSVSSLISIDPSHLSSVVYEGHTYRYDDKEAPFQNNPAEAYPVVNKDLEDDFELPLTERPQDNKYARVDKMVSGFCKRYLFGGKLDNSIIIKRGNGFYTLPDDKVKMLPKGASDLLFTDKNGNIKVEQEIVQGFKNIGPYAKADIEGLKIFFIYQKDSGEAARDFLLNALQNGAIDASFVNQFGKTVNYTKIRSLARAIKHTFTYDTDGDVEFSSLETAISEVEAKLMQKTIDPHFTYLAFYVSPISKESWSSQYRQVVYAGIKEQCIRHFVTVQGFFQDRINDGDGLAYSFTNIHAAILGKIGGIPWKIKTETPEDLIIGVGAFYSRKKDKRYLGSAFCFDGTGIMKEFSCIQEKDRDDLVAKIKKALEGFLENMGGVLPRRIIIHFYKEMSKRDWEPIFDMLTNFGVEEIPVIVVTIGKNESKDILGIKRDCNDLMPLAGTYFKVSEKSWLLYNNSKTDQKAWDDMVAKKTKSHSEAKIPYHFPIKVRFDCRNADVLDDEATIEDLLKQIFQLSRMYWKSVDQQNIPITIKYPSLLTEFLPYFRYEEIPNPEFGCKTLWFL